MVAIGYTSLDFRSPGSQAIHFDFMSSIGSLGFMQLLGVESGYTISNLSLSFYAWLALRLDSADCGAVGSGITIDVASSPSCSLA